MLDTLYKPITVLKTKICYKAKEEQLFCNVRHPQRTKGLQSKNIIFINKSSRVATDKGRRTDTDGFFRRLNSDTGNSERFDSRPLALEEEISLFG